MVDVILRKPKFRAWWPAELGSGVIDAAQEQALLKTDGQRLVEWRGKSLKPNHGEEVNSGEVLLVRLAIAGEPSFQRI